MNVIVAALLLISCFLNLEEPQQHEVRINKVIRIVNNDRRRFLRHGSRRSNAKSSESHASLPGHSLIRPARTMLKSAVNFPHDDQNLVYGNLDNLGITFGKTSESGLYGGFRKDNNFLATLVKMIKNIGASQGRNKMIIPLPLRLGPTPPKPENKSLIGNKLAEITMDVLNMLESKGPIAIQPKSNPLNVKKISPPVILVQQKPKPKTKPFVGNKFKEITMKALDFLGNTEPTSPETKPNSKSSIASTLQEITMKAINFLNYGHHQSDQIKQKAKSYLGNTLQDLTMKGLSLLNSKNPNISQQKSSLIPSIEGKFKEAIKALSFIDSQNLATILKPIKKLIENDDSKKTKSVILVEPKPEPKLKASLGKKLKEMSVKLLDFLGNRSPTPNRPKLSMKEKVNRKKVLEKEKKIQALLDNKGQIEFEMIPREDILLKERTKKIQDFLNSHIPVINAQPLIEDSSVDRAKKVQDFLNSQVPIREKRDKLSLIEKTKRIQDFLNNQVPIFINRDALNDRNASVQSFFNGFNLIDEAENNANEELDLDSSEEQQNYRRMSKKKKKFRNRESKYDSKEDEESGLSASSDYEKNPGNPYTIHRNKYLQNWMWNHYMDGDHMNINPFGPQFGSIGPSGVDLFFGRKWWYFNQDDYKPMG